LEGTRGVKVLSRTRRTIENGLEPSRSEPVPWAAGRQTRKALRPRPPTRIEARPSGAVEPSTERLLISLGEELRNGRRVELVVVGGSALSANGMLGRPTRDVDLLAVRREGTLHHPRPLGADLVAAQRRVMARFGLSDEFLDLGVPAHMLEYGLPAGLDDRLETVQYGPSLTVHFVSRVDHVYFKYLAMVENADEREKHEGDLLRLEPTPAELLAACAWAYEVVVRQAQRAQMLLVETLLRHGLRDPQLVRLATYPLAAASSRGRAGAWLLRRPAWCGRLYGSSIRAAGDARRNLVRSLKGRLEWRRMQRAS
jgi:hypothetical protein